VESIQCAAKLLPGVVVEGEMRMKIGKGLAWRYAAVAAVSATLATIATVEAFPALKREPVLDQVLPIGSPVPKLVKGARIAFAPGQPSGLHLHPVSTVGVVTTGSFIVQVEGQPAQTIHTGEPFFEAAQAHMLRFDNASQTAPAEIVVFYLTDTADRPLIQMLDADGK
jgi:quercetin dioxygenase-like cupin family protein